MALHELNVTKRRELWVDFIYGPLKGQAKVYDISDGPGPDYAGFGIRPGSRVSKLWLTYRGAVVLEYDRGGDRALPPELPANLADIIAQLDRLPTVN